MRYDNLYTVQCNTVQYNAMEHSTLQCYWSFQNVFALDISHFHSSNSSQYGHKLMKFILQNKDKDLLGIYQCGYDPFCVSLLTDRHLKVRCHTDFV